jgi:PBP1b-binding outer membrane lipoprotein LpoB
VKSNIFIIFAVLIFSGCSLEMVKKQSRPQPTMIESSRLSGCDLAKWVKRGFFESIYCYKPVVD